VDRSLLNEDCEQRWNLMRDNVYPYPDARAIEDEAADWVIKLDGDTPPSPEQLDALREWLSRSPAHRKALMAMAHFWNNNILTELSVPLGKKDADRGKQDRLRWAVSAIAVTLLIVIAAILYTPWLLEDKNNGLYVTAVGQQKSIVLSDGSNVELNTNSQVNVRYTGEYRDIHLLQGEAYFDVAKDKERPFRVYVGNSRVQAVGTAFTVYARGADIDVIVTEGKVLLEALDAMMIPHSQRDLVFDEQAYDKSKHARELGLLRAGEKTTVMEGNADKATLAEIQEIDHEDVEQGLSWRRGFLSFNGESLGEVVEEISRYTTVTIEIAGPSLKNIKIGGQLQVGDTESMLDALEANFGLQATRLGYNYVRLSTATN